MLFSTSSLANRLEKKKRKNILYYYDAKIQARVYEEIRTPKITERQLKQLQLISGLFNTNY